jgi:hypothetical protein
MQMMNPAIERVPALALQLTAELDHVPLLGIQHAMLYHDLVTANKFLHFHLNEM